MSAPQPPERGEQCPPNVVLEYLAAGDEQGPDVGAHVKACASCGGYVQALQGAADVYRRARPREQFVAKLARRNGSGLTRARWRLFAVLGGCAAVLLVTRVMPGTGVRDKGGETFSVYLSRGTGEPVLASAGMHVAAGDRLRFHYGARAEGHLMIVDVDGAGEVSVFHPFGDEAAARVAAGQRGVLPETIALDNGPGPERIAAIFRATPFTLKDVRTWLGNPPSGATPSLSCRDCRVQWLILEKQ